MKNNERNLVKIINEICKEEKIEVKSYSDNWIFRLSKNGISKYILGYRFELNSGSIDSICNDKCGVSEILIDHKIPCIEHTFFISPSNLKYMNNDGNWTTMLKYLKKYKKIVCKPNEGTGGNNVMVVTNAKELEKGVDEIFSKSRSLALCPYYEIKNEYRVIILNNEIKLIYSKQMPFVVGNGKDTVLKLLSVSDSKYSLMDFDKHLNYYYIPSKNEIFKLNWKHNLGLGSHANIINDNKLVEKLSQLAIQVTKILNIRFASIDIAEIENDYKVLEINSGVMMDYFSLSSQENYKITKRIYKEAIDLMFKGL